MKTGPFTSVGLFFDQTTRDEARIKNMIVNNRQHMVIIMTVHETKVHRRSRA